MIHSGKRTLNLNKTDRNAHTQEVTYYCKMICLNSMYYRSYLNEINAIYNTGCDNSECSRKYWNLALYYIPSKIDFSYNFTCTFKSVVIFNDLISFLLTDFSWIFCANDTIRYLTHVLVVLFVPHILASFSEKLDIFICSVSVWVFVMWWRVSVLEKEHSL